MLPSVSERVDWEVELAVIVGSPVYRATPAAAAAAIAGYVTSNDVSMRDFQRRTLQWDAGKIFQHTTPVGPYLVTPDEVGPRAGPGDPVRGRRRGHAAGPDLAICSSSQPT